MQRLARLIVLAATAVFTLPFVAPEVASATVDDQRRTVQQIVDELERLHEQADILAEDYNVAVQEKAELDKEVEAAKVRVAEKEAELDELRGDLADVAVRSFTGADADVLGPLFNDAETYSAEMRGDEFRGAALNTGAVSTDDLDALVASLEAERTNLETKVAEQEQLALDISQTLEDVEDLTAQYEERRTQEEARLGELIAQEEQRRAEEAWARAQAELAAQQQAAASSGGQSSSSNSSSGSDSSSSNASSGSSSSSSGNTQSAPAPAPSNIPAVSGLAGSAIAAAQGQLGVPYVYATSNPGVSFDCSGLTHYAWGQAGVYLPRNSRQQQASVPNVPKGSAQPGDLIFFYSPISHVGIYIGGGQMIHAPNSGTVVKVSGVSWDKVTAVGRPG